MSFWASSKFILTFWILTKWSTTSVHGIQLPSTEYNFLPRNTTSVLEIQLPSTSASLQYLTHCFQHEWAKNSINSQSVFCTQFAVCILYPICSLQSAVCILYWPDLYCCFCSNEPQVRTEILELEKTNLVRLSWPLWLMCELYVEEFPRTSTMIEQWLLYINWRRTQMRVLPIWLPLMLFCVCWNEPATGPFSVNISASRLKLHF